MKFQMIHEGVSYDVALDTLIEPRLSEIPESALKKMLSNSFYALGLSPDTVDELNRGGTWCVVSLSK